MSKFGFLSILEEEMDKYFTYDYSINWDKRNHAVELSFILEVENAGRIETIDADGEQSSEDIALEEFVVFYNPGKSKIDEEDYLTRIPYLPKKGLSREFLAYFAKTLNDVATQALDDLMDFLEDDEATDFEIEWPNEAFEAGRLELEETRLYPYPRY